MIVDENFDESKGNLHQSHGLTQNQFRDLHKKQIAGTVEMMKANNASAEQIKDSIFREAYAGHMIGRHERHLYHLAKEARVFNSVTGVRESVHATHKFNIEMYEFMKEHHGFSGCIIHILHFPESPEGRRL